MRNDILVANADPCPPLSFRGRKLENLPVRFLLDGTTFLLLVYLSA